MSIDYAAQFKTITVADADGLTVEYKKHRFYDTAFAAFMSAKRTEDRGIDVAFATTGFGQFHVWADARDRSEYDVCDRCERAVERTVKALSGDLNSADWCESCYALPRNADGDVDEIAPQTEVGEEEIANMVAVKCVACGHLVTDRTAMAHMWNVDTACPACGDGALLWDDGSLHLREDAARSLLAQYDEAVASYVSIAEEPDARDKHIREAQYAIDDLTGDLAETLRSLVTG